MAAASLHGIGKQDVLERYTLDEILTILDECAALQGAERREPDALFVDMPDDITEWEE